MKLAAFFLGGALMLVGIGALVAHGLFRSAFGSEYELFQSVQVGMSEQEVREILGEPYRIHFRDTAPADYYEKGYAFERQPISHKVFVYVATEPIAYVYFDKDDRVEYVFVGGS